MTQDRRDFLKNTSLLAVGSLLGASLSTTISAQQEPVKASAAATLKKPAALALDQGSVPGRTLLINGMHYHIGEQGSGDKVVLLLHGMPDTSGVWLYQIPALVAAGYRVIAPDLLGYGLTDKPADPARYAGEQLLTDVVTMLDTLSIKQMDIVGHDWGGYLSWELALAMPERFRRHVVLSTGNPNSFLDQQTVASVKQNWYMYLDTQAAANALYAANNGAFYKQVIIPSHPDIDEVWSRMQKPEAMLGMLNWDRGNNLADLYLAASTGQLSGRSCRVPTLGIAGTDDQYLWESQMTDSAKWMDAPWRYAAVEGASHWVMLDHAQQTNELLLEWLAQS